MKSRNPIIAAIAVTAVMLSTASCLKQSETHYSTYMTAVVDGSGDSKSLSYLVTDDSIKVFPGTNLISGLSSLNNNQRIFGTFTIPSGEITDPVQVEFVSYEQLVQNDIMESSQPDTLGNDPMTILSAWHSGGVYNAGRFITLAYRYNGSGYLNHTMELVDDTSLAGNPDADGYYHLSVRHNAANDPSPYVFEGITTYPLGEKYTAAGIKGLKIKFNNLEKPVTERDSIATITF